MAKSEYEAFVQGFLEANDWPSRKDGCPLGLIDALSENDKSRAERALIDRLSPGDDWPIRGLGHLKSRLASPRLRRLLAKAKGAMKAVIAEALWRIDEDDAMADIAIAASVECYTDSRGSPQTYQMIDIIYCLAAFPHAAARERLQALTRSPNYLIAYNATRALKLSDGAT